MMTLKILENDNGRLVTDHGIFRIESLNFEDDIVMNEGTGEFHWIEGSTTDENGRLSELDVD